MARIWPLFALLLCAIACGGDDDLTPDEALEKSCGGEIIPNCRAYEYAVVREAEVTPAEVEIGDPLARIRVRLTFDHCAEATEQHTVGLTALYERGGADAGTGRVFPLDSFADNSARDMDPAPGVIDAEVENFFLEPVPASRELVLRFEPRIDVCRGGAVELPYRTGPAFGGAGP